RKVSRSSARLFFFRMTFSPAGWLVSASDRRDESTGDQRQQTRTLQPVCSVACDRGGGGGGSHGRPRDGQPITVQPVSFVCWPAPPRTSPRLSVRIVSLLSASASVVFFLIVSPSAIGRDHVACHELHK